MVLRRPGREHPVIAIQVSTADVLDVRAGEPVARVFAAADSDLTNDTKRSFSATTSECSDLLIGDASQRDFDRRPVSRFRLAISALRSSPSGTVLPAR